MARKNLIKKEIDLSGLPKWRIGEGLGKPNTINWLKSIGHKVNGIYDSVNFEVEIVNYIPKTHKLTIKYNNIEYEISTDMLKNCKIGRVLGKITKEFKIEIGTRLKDNTRDITIIDKEYRQEENIDKLGRKSIANVKWYKYHCNLCGLENWIREVSLLGQKSGCAICFSTCPKVVEDINSIYKTDPWMIPIIGEECAKTHTKGSSDEVEAVCPDCGRIKENVIINCIYKNHSIGCVCQDGISYPNKFMFNLLEQLCINFETEYNPEWIKPRRYDFYIPSEKLIIEMDGGFHSKDNKMTKKTKEESKAIDNYKDELAKKHGFEVIRIDCDYNYNNRFAYIKKEITNHKNFNKLFNLNLVDWNECNIFATSNLIKIACEYKKNNPNMTTTEIGNIMGYSQTGVANWLRNGNELGWCYYNPKDEVKISLEKGHKFRKDQASPVEVFKNDISLGIYPSTAYLTDNGEKIFGIKFVRACITNCCLEKPKYKTYKGFVFRYISKEEYEQRKLQENLKQVI